MSQSETNLSSQSQHFGKESFHGLFALKAFQLLLLIGIAPALLLATVISESAPRFAFIAFTCGLVLCEIQLWRWPCPRCGKPYLRRWWFSKVNDFARYCIYCQLPYRA